MRSLKSGRILLTLLAIATAAGTAVADLSALHAQNPNWPPHARLHAVWNVMQVTLTQVLAIALLWTGGTPTRLRARVAALLLLVYSGSFFAAAWLAPAFGASLSPDVAPDAMPPRPFGLDGNLVSVMLATPLVLLGWWLCERGSARGLENRPEQQS